MPRNTTNPRLLDEALTIKIHDLNRFGLIAENKIFKTKLQWNSATGYISEISLKVDNRKKLITLDYIFRGSVISYNIKMVRVQSNLGKGFYYYFICPSTQKQCRNLYLFRGYFLHRTATKNTMYSSQIKTKSERNIKKVFDNILQRESLIDELRSKHFKKTSDNKPTNRFLAIIKELEKRGVRIRT
jgi:hypothetical protein